MKLGCSIHERTRFKYQQKIMTDLTCNRFSLIVGNIFRHEAARNEQFAASFRLALRRQFQLNRLTMAMTTYRCFSCQMQSLSYVIDYLSCGLTTHESRHDQFSTIRNQLTIKQEARYECKRLVINSYYVFLYTACLKNMEHRR